MQHGSILHPLTLSLPELDEQARKGCASVAIYFFFLPVELSACSLAKLKISICVNVSKAKRDTAKPKIKLITDELLATNWEPK